MVEHLWFIFALTAAVLWGLAYVATEKILSLGLTPPFMILIQTVVTFPVALLVATQFADIKQQFNVFASNPMIIALTVFMAFAIVGGEMLILFSISEKNATLASLIEITYPIFTFIFAWIFLKEVQVNWQQAVGGLLIFSGVILIYLKS